MIKLSLRPFIAASIASTFAAAETADEYHTRMGELLDETFANQNQSTAWWVGFSHPIHGDQYWVFGNSSDTDMTFPPDVPATTDDHFYIGSISKTFGATVNLKLIEQGLFGLNQTIDSIIPDFVVEFPEYSNYTPADLMGMQTLVPDFINDPDGVMKEFAADPSVRFSIFEIIEHAMTRYPVTLPEEWASLGYTVEDFGLKAYYEYSSTNVLAMEYLAENVTGQTMQDLVQDLVLSPLNLDNTAEPPRDAAAGTILPNPAVVSYIGEGCVTEFSEIGHNVSVGFRDDELADSIVNTGTAGSMYSSIPDLLQWAKSGVGDSLLSPETVAARHIFNPVSMVYSYGLGIHLTLIEEEYGTWYGHNGDALGSNAQAAKSDELNASYASAINSCGYGGLHSDGMRILAKDLMSSDDNNSTKAPSSTPAETSASAAPSTSGQETHDNTAPASTGFGVLPSAACLVAAVVVSFIV